MLSHTLSLCISAVRMGLGVSTEDRERYKADIGAHLYAAMKEAGGLPDVGIDQALLDNADLRPPVALQVFRVGVKDQWCRRTFWWVCNTPA